MQHTRIVGLLVGLGLLLSGAPSFAQAPFPGGVQVNGGWVPCTHPIAVQAGLGCVAAAPGTVVAPAPPVQPGDVRDGQVWTCVTNPYQYGQPHAEQVCSWVPVDGPGSQSGTGGPVPAVAWQIGQYYKTPYGELRLVLAVVPRGGTVAYQIVRVSPGAGCGSVYYWAVDAPPPYVWVVEPVALPAGCHVDPSALLF